jgi:hypothetical protein
VAAGLFALVLLRFCYDLSEAVSQDRRFKTGARCGNKPFAASAPHWLSRASGFVRFRFATHFRPAGHEALARCVINDNEVRRFLDIPED